MRLLLLHETLKQTALQVKIIIVPYKGEGKRLEIHCFSMNTIILKYIAILSLIYYITNKKSWKNSAQKYNNTVYQSHPSHLNIMFTQINKERREIRRMDCQARELFHASWISKLSHSSSVSRKDATSRKPAETEISKDTAFLFRTLLLVLVL